MSWPWGGKNGSTCVNDAQQTRPHIHVFQNTLYYWFLCLTDTAAAFQPPAEHAPTTTTNISPWPSASPSGGDVLVAACPTAIMNFGGRPHGQGRQWSRSEGRPMIWGSQVVWRGAGMQDPCSPRRPALAEQVPCAPELRLGCPPLGNRNRFRQTEKPARRDFGCCSGVSASPAAAWQTTACHTMSCRKWHNSNCNVITEFCRVIHNYVTEKCNMITVIYYSQQCALLGPLDGYNIETLWEIKFTSVNGHITHLFLNRTQPKLTWPDVRS